MGDCLQGEKNPREMLVRHDGLFEVDDKNILDPALQEAVEWRRGAPALRFF